MPDSRRLVYAAPDGIRSAEIAANEIADGERISTAPGDHAPAVSSRGDIAYVDSARQLWQLAKPAGRLLATGLMAGQPPVWAPDGTAIAYTASEGHGEVYVLERTPSPVAVNVSRAPATSQAGPAWAADSSFLAYEQPGLDSPLIRVNRDGTGRADLEEFSPAELASFSPDGRWVAYLVLDEEFAGIWGGSTQGPGGAQLSPYGTQSSPAWSPASDRLALSLYGVCGRDGIHVLDVLTSLTANSWIRAPDTRLTNECRRRGTDGDDLLRGSEYRDVLAGGGGDDRIFGRGGDDSLRGDSGRDRLDGGAGRDDVVADGDRAADTVSCGSGSDRVRADKEDVVAHDCERVTRR
jgi:hypothetical protein